MILSPLIFIVSSIMNMRGMSTILCTSRALKNYSLSLSLSLTNVHITANNYIMPYQARETFMSPKKTWGWGEGSELVNTYN